LAGEISLFLAWVKVPTVSRWGIVLLALLLVVLCTPLWLPLFGTSLAVSEAVQTADAALVLEGTGRDALDTAEAWRQQGVVRNVVVVEAPIKTHALVAYWSDFVRWGVAAPSPTPAAYLRVVRAPTTQAAQQARAALAALTDFGDASVIVPGGGGIGSRLVARELDSVFGPRGISAHLVSSGLGNRDPGRWWQNADDRRAVLDSWLQLLVPALNGYDAITGS
jgi:hypothetical protein